MYLLISLILGALLSFSFAPFEKAYLAFIALFGLSVLWIFDSKNRTTRTGFVFGLGYFGVGVNWVYISLQYYGGAPVPFAIGMNILLVLYLALYPALTGFLLRKYTQVATLNRALLIPLFWGVGELIRAYFLTGFPWISLGYSQTTTFIGALAPIGGVFFIGFVMCLIASLSAYALVQRKWLMLSFPALLLALCFAAQLLSFTTPTGKTLNIALVQGNIEQAVKFDAQQVEQHLSDYISLTTLRDEDVVIWPETAVTFLEQTIQETIIKPLDEIYKTKNQTVVIGLPSQTGEDYYNMALALGNGGGRYAKNHLLPFGEYLPLRFIFGFFNQFVNMAMSDFARGGNHQPPLMTAGVPAGMSICFEAAFGREIRNALPQAQYLINTSNDAWFKDSFAADQHLQMNQMRAREMARPLVRAANDGYSAAIDLHGNIVKKLPRFERAILSTTLQPVTGTTPYARFGNAIILSLLLTYAIIVRFIVWMRNRHARAVSRPSDRT